LISTDTKALSPTHLNRRKFVQGIAAGGLLAALPSWVHAGSKASASSDSIPVLRGREIDLVVAEMPVNFTGAVRMATTINGSVPAPTLRLREGDEVTIRVTNKLSVPTSIHWHGILLPYEMDGVPGISFKGIAPGETFVYRFKLRQSGTYWYHSHSGFQEMTGMYGALIVEPRTGEKHQSDQDHVIQLSDWTDEDPMSVFSKLKVESDVYNLSQSTFFDFTRDVSDMGLQSALEKRQMWNRMRMNPTDLADLSAATMTYLMNGTTPAGNWTGLFKPGERVRLRFINAASNSFYDVRIPGLRMTVIQADGQDVETVTVDEFRFGPGETYDVMVEPRGEAYTLFAQSMDRSGYAFGTLATRQGLSAPVPSVDPVEWLTMADMMGSMNHKSMSGMAMDANGDSHSGMHGGMAMNHSQHSSQDTQEIKHDLSKPSGTVQHARTEYGASVDMRVDTPSTKLNDPGIGLRDLSKKELRPLGHRVLTLADLKSIDGVIDDYRTPVRELELHLTGNMERYSWSFDGLEFGKSTPVSLRQNERVRIILQNDTMMTHPMHLHGMWSELETDQGELRVRRHTIPVQPAQRISFLTTPHDLGRWAWHCHLLFHMDAGMFREVVVS
jgi:CopA family copper-resistance protein